MKINVLSLYAYRQLCRWLEMAGGMSLFTACIFYFLGNKGQWRPIYISSSLRLLAVACTMCVGR